MKTYNKIDYWKIVDECDWSKDFNHKRIKSFLSEKYDRDTRFRLDDWAHRRQRHLYVVLEDFSEEKVNYAHGWLPVSDDGMNDLTAHIIGLGKKEYISSLANPYKVYKRAQKRDYQENFLYSFGFDDIYT